MKQWLEQRAEGVEFRGAVGCEGSLEELEVCLGMGISSSEGSKASLADLADEWFLSRVDGAHMGRQHVLVVEHGLAPFVRVGTGESRGGTRTLLLGLCITISDRC